jgi:hypothetical protein
VQFRTKLQQVAKGPGFPGLLCFLRFTAKTRRLLRVILRLKCTNFCAALVRPIKVNIDHPQVMMRRDWVAVADPILGLSVCDSSY